MLQAGFRPGVSEPQQAGKDGRGFPTGSARPQPAGSAGGVPDHPPRPGMETCSKEEKALLGKIALRCKRKLAIVQAEYGAGEVKKEGKPSRPEMRASQSKAAQKTAAPVPVEAATSAKAQASSQGVAKPARGGPRETHGASRPPPASGSEPPGRCLAAIPEGHESEESVSQERSRSPARGSAGKAGVKRKEPPRQPRNAEYRKKDRPPTESRAPEEVAPKKPVASGHKEEHQGNARKSDRSDSSESYSSAISEAVYQSREAQSRVKKLQDRRDKHRAAKAEEARKRHAKPKAKRRRRSQRIDGPESQSSYSYSYSESESDETEKKHRRRGPAREPSPAPTSSHSEEEDSDDSRQKERRSRSRSDRRKQEDGQEARQKEVPPPWTKEGALLQKGGKKGRGRAAKAMGPGDFRQVYANHGFHDQKGSSASFQHTRTGTLTEADRQPPASAVEWMAEQERKQAFHQFVNYWNRPRDWPAQYYDQGWPFCPPRVEGKEWDLFRDAIDTVFTFHQLGFTFVGADPWHPLKQHWMPHPCSSNEAKWKKGQKGGRKDHARGPYGAQHPDGKGRRAERDAEDTEYNDKTGSEEQACKGWFTAKEDSGP
jgi:hypothetical protein